MILKKAKYKIRHKISQEFYCFKRWKYYLAEEKFWFFFRTKSIYYLISCFFYYVSNNFNQIKYINRQILNKSGNPVFDCLHFFKSSSAAKILKNLKNQKSEANCTSNIMEYSMIEIVRIYIRTWLFSTMVTFATLLVFAAFGFTPFKGQMISKANFHLNQKLNENISLFLRLVFNMDQIKKEYNLLCYRW